MLLTLITFILPNNLCSVVWKGGCPSGHAAKPLDDMRVRCGGTQNNVLGSISPTQSAAHREGTETREKETKERKYGGDGGDGIRNPDLSGHLGK